nr:MAG TPA: Dna polymerase B [Caudoviricetes sp.]
MKTVVKKKDNFTTVHNNLILDEKLSWKAKGLLIYMLSRPAGWKYKSAEIAKNSTDGRDSVRNGLKELAENKYISRQKNSDGSLTYYIFEDSQQNNIKDYLQKPKLENPSLEKPETENPKLENPKLDNPSLYKRKNTNNKRIIVIKEYIYKSEKFLETYSDFKNMRDDIKKPMTERAEKILLTKLKKLAGENNEELAIKILEQSILNNWQDIYPLKEENNANGSNGYKKSYQSKNDKHNQKTDRTNDGKNWN